MSAYDILSGNNGLKTTKTVVDKQQNGVDAAQKANPQETSTAQQMNMNTASQMMGGKQPQTAPPQNAHENAVRTNQQTAEGMMNGNIPVVKQETQPQEKSFVDKFKEVFGDSADGNPEQEAKRKKRERTRAIISAVGDGLRALSNMYFASKGALVKHDPNQDLSAGMAKRMQMIDAQREKNKSAWVSGYQKAMALDEEKRKNDNNLAEQIRYHDQLATNRERVGDQNDVKLDQNQQRIDLTKLKYTNDADYKNSLLEIKKMLADGQISHWGAQDAMARLRENRLASKANAASGGNSATAGCWYEYYDMFETEAGKKQLEAAKHKYGIKNVTNSNIRYLMDKIKGRRSPGAPSNTGAGKKPSKGGKSPSNGGKKLTGVKW